MKVKKQLLESKIDIDELHVQVLTQIDKLKSWCTSPLDVLCKQSSVSLWKIKDHIEHLTVTGRSTIMRIEEALQSKNRLSATADGQKLFQLGAIPRGETKSPTFAKPKDANIKKIMNNCVRFHNQMTELSEKLKAIAKHDGTSEHPMLGYLTPKQWLQFVHIHQKHHLEIISDILNTVKIKTV